MNRRLAGRVPQTVAVAVLAYLAGSLPVVYLLGRVAGVDLRRYGSGNVGSSNLTVAAGPGAGLAGWISDAGKGGLAVLGARRTTRDESLAGLALLGALGGQCWPALLGWRGGRGVATLVGGMLVLTPRAAPWALGAMAAIGGLRPWANGRGPIGTALHAGAVPVGVLVGAAVWPLVCLRQAGSRRAAATAAGALLLLIVRRLTANGRPRAGGDRLALLARIMLDRDRW
jgi:acyl phosphate:glycerol-3-phosphate acyltransferase